MKGTAAVLISALSTAAYAGPVTQKDASCLKSCLDWQKISSSVAGDATWNDLIDPYNLRIPFVPNTVVAVKKASEVSAALKCVRQCGDFKVQARGGGHSYGNFGLGGRNGSVVIDLAGLNKVTVRADGTADIEGGLRLGNVDLALWDQGKRAMSHGTCAGVGIGGHSTHGGYGFDSRIWGLALDHILDVDLVLADGTELTASAKANSDLFWAVRGAADSIAIVTKFHVRTQAAPESLVYWTYDIPGVIKDVATSVAAFEHIQDFALNATVQDRRLAWGWYHDSSAFALRGKFFGSLAEFNSKIAPELLRGLPTPTKSDIRAVGWLDSQSLYHSGTLNHSTLAQPNQPGKYHEHDNMYAKSIVTPERFTKEALTSFFTYTSTAKKANWYSIGNLYGGPDSQINIYDENWSSYKDRDSLFVIQNVGSVLPPPFDDSLKPFLKGMNEAITKKMPNTQFSAYTNYIDPELTPAEAHELYYGQKIYSKLLSIKKTVDTAGTFYNPLAIGA
ncbi:hypothetical protein JDV02_010651 [Purpureocillium takamizusanense]|uniref:FAD-binding PCMH-type domain-containing protein n=1 Tax=Purpureocillium takamizusanense TaxID=2060973 RepID=A0A9Q8VFD9_9HYPO|nr:uncharacterized protein JDV02_010651 [Purpureocillium takamizusanense]UNI24935.1 hypothetical protein JDV02_010651 [Purpureocillium takamizusanense]